MSDKYNFSGIKTNADCRYYFDKYGDETGRMGIKGLEAALQEINENRIKDMIIRLPNPVTSAGKQYVSRKLGVDFRHDSEIQMQVLCDFTAGWYSAIEFMKDSK